MPPTCSVRLCSPNCLADSCYSGALRRSCPQPVRSDSRNFSHEAIKNAPIACSTRARKESRWPWLCGAVLCGAACNGNRLHHVFALALPLLFLLQFVLHVLRSNGAPSDRGCIQTCSVIKLSDITERKSGRNAMQCRRGQSWRWCSVIA